MTTTGVEAGCLREEIYFSGGRVRFLRGAGSVTPSMTLLELDGSTFLVDAGANAFSVDQVLSEEALEVDGIFLTHGHLDHVGALPSLLAEGVHAPVFATDATLSITRILLGDAIRLRGGQYRDVRAFLGGLDHISRKVVLAQKFKPFANRDLEVTFHEAGHILGSASIEFRTKRSRVLFSGDLGPKGAPILRDPQSQWDDDQPFDLVVLESTYGDVVRDQPAPDVEKSLLSVIERAQQNKGQIIVPAFAIGRTQTLIYHLNSLVESGRMPAMPVALDSPLGLRMTETYSSFQALFDEESLRRLSLEDDPLDFKGLYAVRKARDSRRLRDVDAPMMIISGAGMCNGGRVVGHLKELLPCRETEVLFIGYQAEGTLGRELQALGNFDHDNDHRSVKIDGETVSVRARITSIPGLSAHADQSELVAWLKAIPNVRAVALHHGEPAAQHALMKRITDLE